MRYIPRLLLFAAILTFYSCLNEHSKGSLDEDQVFTSAKDVYVNAVATLYNYIGGNADSQGLQGTYRGVYDYNTLGVIGTMEAFGRTFICIVGRLMTSRSTTHGSISIRWLCSVMTL